MNKCTLRGSMSCSIVLQKAVIADVLWRCMQVLVKSPKGVGEEDIARIMDALGTEPERETVVKKACVDLRDKLGCYCIKDDRDGFAFMVHGLSLGASCGHGEKCDEWWFTVRISSDNKSGAESFQAVLPLLFPVMAAIEWKWLETVTKHFAAVPTQPGQSVFA